MAGGDTAPAVDDRCVAEIGEARCQLGDGPMSAIGVEMLEVEPVDRSGDVSGTGIDRLLVPPESGGRTGVDHAPAVSDRIGDTVGVDSPRPVRWNRVDGRSTHRHGGGEFSPGLRPCGDASVEHADLVVADGSQHPPESGGGRSSGVVVGDDVIHRADPRSTEDLRERLDGRQRMSTSARCAGEFTMQVDEDGTGQVAGVVLATTTIVVVEVEPDVAGHGPFGVVGPMEDGEEFGRGDERHAPTVSGGAVQGRTTLVVLSSPEDDRSMTDSPDESRLDELRAVDELRQEEDDPVGEVSPAALDLPVETPVADALDQRREVPLDEESG